MMIAALAVGVVVLIAVSIVDVTQRRIPNAITYPMIGSCVIVAVSSLVVGNSDRASPALIGAAALGLLLYMPHRIAPASMGLGDVKLAIPLGFAIGWVQADPTATFLVVGWTLASAALIGLAMAAGVAWSKGQRITSGQTVAFGPALSIAAACAVVGPLL